MTHTVTVASASEAAVGEALRAIFVGHRVLLNARKASDLKRPISGSPISSVPSSPSPPLWLEVDVWYPDLKLCFEHQDEHHYHDVFYAQKSLYEVQKNDDVKRRLVSQRGESLIHVPYWWDGASASLQATIEFFRPDLSHLFSHHPSDYSLIPANPPFAFSSDVQLSLVSFSQSIQHIESNQWWLGEKYDGVRCCWNPTQNQLCSRQGLAIDMPLSVERSFGQNVFDGEIWCGRGLFLEAVSVIHSDLDKLNWPLFRVVCFDEASQSMSCQTFETRYSFLLSKVHGNHPTIIVAPRLLLPYADLVPQLSQQVMEEGGEGIILQKSSSIYSYGRSADLIKIKGSKFDQEALVIDVNSDGSLLLQLPEGLEFTVAKSECILHRQAVSGDVVSFSYDFARHRSMQSLFAVPVRNSVSAKIGQDSQQLRKSYGHAPPRPLVYRLRDDLNWDDVKSHSNKQSNPHSFLNEAHQKIKEYAPSMEDDRNSNNNSNSNRIYEKKLRATRHYLEHFMERKRLDPLIADNWYNVWQEIIQHRKIKNSATLLNILASLYPEVRLDRLQFRQPGYWSSRANQRNWFDSFAKLKNFDPLVSRNWHSLSHADIKSVEGGESLLNLFSTISNAIANIYPEISFEPKYTKLYWKDKAKRKQWLAQFAKTKGFDPRSPDQWRSVSHADVASAKGGQSLLDYYSKSVAKAVVDIYPDIGYDPKVPKHYWHDRAKRKQWLDNFASRKNIEPRNPEHWLNISAADVKSEKEGKSFLGFYSKSVSSAVTDIYPDIGYEPKAVPRNYWQDTLQRRKWFDEFAKSKHFSPLNPDNWLSVTCADIQSVQKGKTLLRFYSKNIAKAVSDLYPEIGFVPKAQKKT